MADNDEFAEFEINEAAFDEMFAAGEPVTLVASWNRVIRWPGSQDIVSVPQGLQISIGDSTMTSAGPATGMSTARRPVVHHEHSGRELAS